MNYNLYLMRHGFSCANTFQLQTKQRQLKEYLFHKIGREYVPTELMKNPYKWFDGNETVDSFLTELGMLQSIQAGMINETEFDYFYSSSMVRAIQTCYFFLLGRYLSNRLPNKVIINVTPYLKESGNRTSDKLYSNKQITKFCNQLNQKNVLEKLLGYINQFREGNKIYIENIDDFILKINFKIIEGNESYNNSAENMIKFMNMISKINGNILAVSHNHTIKQFYCQVKNPIKNIKNTSIVKIDNINKNDKLGKCTLIYKPRLSNNIFNNDKKNNFLSNTICNYYGKIFNLKTNMENNKRSSKFRFFIIKQNRQGYYFSNSRISEGKGNKTMIEHPKNNTTFRITTNGAKGMFSRLVSRINTKSKDELNSYITNIKAKLNSVNSKNNTNNQLSFDIGFIYLENSSQNPPSDQLLQSIYYDICWRNRILGDTFNLYRVANGKDRLGIIIKKSFEAQLNDLSNNKTLGKCLKYTHLNEIKENNKILFKHSRVNSKVSKFIFNCTPDGIIATFNINQKQIIVDKNTTQESFITQILNMPRNNIKPIQNNSGRNNIKPIQSNLAGEKNNTNILKENFGKKMLELNQYNSKIHIPILESKIRNDIGKSMQQRDIIRSKLHSLRKEIRELEPNFMKNNEGKNIPITSKSMKNYIEIQRKNIRNNEPVFSNINIINKLNKFEKLMGELNSFNKKHVENGVNTLLSGNNKKKRETIRSQLHELKKQIKEHKLNFNRQIKSETMKIHKP